MDEVLAVGDASFQEKCFDTFNNYKREGKTIVLVSHDLAALEEYCDRVLLLDRGQIVSDGPASEVTSTYHRMVADRARVADRGEPAGGRRRRRGREHPGGRDHLGRPPRRRDEAALRFDTGDADDPRHQAARAPGRRRFRLRHGHPRADGLLVAGTNTFLDHITVASHPVGRVVSIRYTIDSLPLLAGGYILQVSTHDMSGSLIYDAANPACELSRRQPRRPRRPARDARALAGRAARTTCPPERRAAGRRLLLSQIGAPVWKKSRWAGTTPMTTLMIST